MERLTIALVTFLRVVASRWVRGTDRWLDRDSHCGARGKFFRNPVSADLALADELSSMVTIRPSGTEVVEFKGPNLILSEFAVTREESTRPFGGVGCNGVLDGVNRSSNYSCMARVSRAQEAAPEVSGPRSNAPAAAFAQLGRVSPESRSSGEPTAA